MKNLLKKMMPALAGVGLVMMLGTPTAVAADVCRWGPADRAAERMTTMNPDAASRTLSAANADHVTYIDELVDFYNGLPPQDVTIDRDAVVEVLILDKPRSSTIAALFLGEKCFLGGTLVPKTDGPRMPQEQGV